MHTAAVVLLLTGLSGPAPESEVLPAPQPVEAPVRVYALPSLPPGIGFVRPNPYHVWTYYGVNNQGQMAPRVLEGPYGAFAPPDGRPFPWTSVHETSYRPFFTR
jgi:hypothetical protein